MLAYTFVPLSLFQERTFFCVEWGPVGGSARGVLAWKWRWSLPFLKSLRPFLGTWWRAWARPTSSTMAGSTLSPILPRRSSYSGHASWVPAKAAQRGFAKSAAREELTYALSRQASERQPGQGRSSEGTCSDVPSSSPWWSALARSARQEEGHEGYCRRDLSRQGPKREREKAVAKLVNLLDFLDLPIAVRARQYHDKTVHLRRGARGLRVSTLRMRIRAWTKLQTWLEATVGRSWPHSVDDVLGTSSVSPAAGKVQGYCCRFSRPCASWRPLGRCAPRVACTVLDNFLREHEISGDQGTKARKGKAPMIPVMVLFALELVVLDTVRPLYVRGFAWVKLLKFWASLRYDDLQWLALASMVLTAAGLHATLPRTKTSGPGKRAATLTATISSDAWLVSPRWLAEGFAIWKHFETDRDYLLPCPTPDLQGVRDCHASYNDAAALSQALYNELRWPKLCPERGWQGSADEALLCQGAGRFWTEHSERNGLTSMGAALGFGEAQRKHLGRWTTDCSEGYVRTTTAIVHEIQGKCARALREKGLARRISFRSLSSWRISTGSWRPRGTRVRRELMRRRGFNS